MFPITVCSVNEVCPVAIGTITDVTRIKSESNTYLKAFFSPSLSKNAINPVTIIKMQLMDIDIPKSP